MKRKIPETYEQDSRSVTDLTVLTPLTSHYIRFAPDGADVCARTKPYPHPPTIVFSSGVDQPSLSQSE